ncbi:gfo/Idh/MocA family oxidoreductase [Paenibacillus sp. LMG 31461]|uniref:Gfo/Idh/MocA family oxidoreductase n=1 Tax=Paenibacillus plantarum TaxID=2654975 RepID=A0ABX1XKE2_9BACL|nr:Gfo/Idh/MocA family oxidoreductase [Paenibacillus plantarum]NOU68879.1 gfo/Idh/MocA family oxidoreductase [Paenibacillus plantarum]
MNLSPVQYNFEFEQKLRICFIGAGGHSFRNIYPTLQYAPVDLVAICDTNGDRAMAYARQFGANATYTDYKQMFAKEKPDAVFIVTSYTPDGRVQATDMAMDALRAGIHVWMEKPTAASSDEVHQLIQASRESGHFVMTGLKKQFFPGVEKVKQIISSPEFGTPTSISIKYPQSMPPFSKRADLKNVTSLLDHIYHPGSILHYLMGRIGTLSYQWEPLNGSSVTNLRFLSGAIGTLHMASGIAGSSPLERLEVIGQGANVVLENGVKLTYYRKTKSARPYGRTASYLVEDDEAPLYWEPEFSLGQLYNKNIFMLGYVPEVLHFCESILSGQPPQKGTLEASLEISKLFEAYRTTPEDTLATINER